MDGIWFVSVLTDFEYISVTCSLITLVIELGPFQDGFEVRRRTLS